MSEASPVNSSSLHRSLGLYAVLSVVVGSVVGSGIFVSSASMARDLKSGWLLLLVWALGGLFTVFGALTQSELVAQIPKTGGLFHTMREIYGELTGFLFGWATFAIAGSGAIAAISFVFAKYVGEFFALPHLSPELEALSLHLPLLGQLHPLADIGTKAVAGLLVIFLTFINIRGVRSGAMLQSISTSSKVVALAVVVGTVFLFGSDKGSWSNVGSVAAPLSGWALWAAIATALSGAFWAYDGWGTVSFLAGEVHHPEKTLPRGILIGTFICVTLYLLVNLAYLYILPIADLGSVPDDRIATAVVSRVFGPLGAQLVAALIILCTFDATNSCVLTNARVYWAMAKENMFPARLGSVHPKYRSPDTSLIVQCLWSLALLVTGSFDIIFSMYVFVNWLLYALMGLAVFLLRMKRAKDPQSPARPFSVPGYPFVPALFVLFSVAFLSVTLATDIQAYRSGNAPLINSAAGLALVFAGLPVYALTRRQWMTRNKAANK